MITDNPTSDQASSFPRVLPRRIAAAYSSRGTAQPLGDEDTPPLTLPGPGDDRQQEQEASALRRSYQANQQAAEKQRRQDETLAKKTANAQREADFRAKGQKFYTDSFGDLKPEVDTQGEPRFSQSSWKKAQVEGPDGGKMWALTRRNENGDEETQPPKLVTSGSLKDPNLYYDFKGMRGTREVAGHVDDFVQHSNPEYAAVAQNFQSQRDAAFRGQALKPLQDSYDSAVAELDGVLFKKSEVAQKIGDLSRQQAEVRSDPRFGQKQGGLLGIGADLTDDAKRLQAQHDQIAAQVAELTKTGNTLDEDVRGYRGKTSTGDIDIEKEGDLGRLTQKARAAKLEIDAFSHESKLGELGDLVERRRAWLRSQGRKEDGDGVLRQIEQKQKEFGFRLSKISQQRSQMTDAIEQGRAAGEAAPVDAGQFAEHTNTHQQRVTDYAARVEALNAKVAAGATDEELTGEATAIESERKTLLADRARLDAWSGKINAERTKEAVATVSRIQQDRDGFKPDFFVGNWSKLFSGGENRARDERMSKLRGEAGSAWKDGNVSALGATEKTLNYIGAIVSTPLDVMRGRTLADIEAQQKHDQARQLIGDFKGADALKVLKMQGDFSDRLARGEPIVRVNDATAGAALRNLTDADSLESLQSLHDVLRADDGTSSTLGALVGGREISKSALQVASLINALPGVSVDFKTLGIDDKNPEAFAKHAVLSRAVAELIQKKYAGSALAGMVAGSLDQFIGMNALAAPVAGRLAVAGKRTDTVAKLGGVKTAAERGGLWLASGGVGASQSYYENPSMSFAGRWVDIIGNTIPLAVGEVAGNRLEHAVTKNLPATLNGGKLALGTGARIAGGTAGEITSDIVQSLIQGQPFDGKLEDSINGNLGAVIGMSLIRGAGEVMPLRQARQYAQRVAGLRSELGNRLADVRAVIDTSREQTPEGERARAILSALPAGAVENFNRIVSTLPAGPVERAKDVGQLRGQNAQRLGQMLVAGSYAEALQHRFADTAGALTQIERAPDYVAADPRTGKPVDDPFSVGANRDAARALVKVANGLTADLLTEGERRSLGVIGNELGTEMVRVVNGQPVITDAARGWITDLAPATRRLITETESQRLAAATKQPRTSPSPTPKAQPVAASDETPVAEDLRKQLDTMMGAEPPANPVAQADLQEAATRAGVSLPAENAAEQSAPAQETANPVESPAPEAELQQPAAVERTPGTVVPAESQGEPLPAAAPSAEQSTPTGFKLPRDLAAAKPRFSYGQKQFAVSFESDLDKALYIIAQPKPSARDADFARAVIEHTGMTEQQARAAGAVVRQQLKAMAKDSSPGLLVVPQIHGADESAPKSEAATTLPERTADTMSEAIALGSPSGKMSKRARTDAQERVRAALFGKDGLPAPQAPQPSEIDTLRRQAKELRDFAARGLKPKAHTKKASELEAKADALERAQNREPLAPPQSFKDTQRELLQKIDAAIEGAPSEEDFIRQAKIDSVQEEIKGRLNRNNDAGRKAADEWVTARARELAAASTATPTITVKSGNSRYTVTNTAETLARLRKAVDKRVGLPTKAGAGNDSVSAAKVDAGFKAAKTEADRRGWMDMMTDAQLKKFDLDKKFVRVGPGQVLTREAAAALANLKLGRTPGDFDIEASTPSATEEITGESVDFTGATDDALPAADRLRAYLPLADKIASQFRIPGLESDDVRQEARQVLIKAVREYNPGRGEFAPFAGTVIRNRLRDRFNREVIRVRTQGLSTDATDETGRTLLDAFVTGETGRDAAERSETRELVSKALRALPDRLRSILQARADGETLEAIAERQGVSKQRIGELAKTGIVMVDAELRQLGVRSFQNGILASTRAQLTGETLDPASPRAFNFITPPNDERAREDAEEVRIFESKINDQLPDGATPVRLSARRLGDYVQSGQQSGGSTASESIRTHRALEAAFGKRIIFVEPSSPVAWQAVTAKRRANTILVNTQAPNPFLAIVGHELGHNLKNQAPDLHRTFAAVVAEVAPMPSDYVAEKRAQGYAPGAVEDEWVNDVLGARFDDPKFWRSVADASERRTGGADLNFRELMERAVAWLTKLGTRIKNLLHNRTDDPFVGDVERLRRTAAEVLVEYQQRGPHPDDPMGARFASSDAELSIPAPAGANQITPSDLKGEKINRAWTSFAPESGTLGVPRADMPQIKSEHRGALVQFLKARGIEHAQQEVTPGTLKPTQAEYSPAKVEKARKFDGESRAILVSADGHVVDGHHQWMAAMTDASAAPIRVIRLNSPIRDLLPIVRQFPSSDSAGGGTGGTPTGPKPAPVPGRPGEFFRSTPDSLRERGLDVARQIYTRRGQKEAAAVAREIVDHVGEERAAEMAIARGDDGIPADVRTLIYGDLLTRKARRLTDPKSTKAERAQAQREIQKLQATKPAQFTERGQEISALQHVYKDVHAATMSEYLDGVRKAQDGQLGESGTKAVTDATNAINDEQDKAITAATKALGKALHSIPVTLPIWQRYRDQAADRLISLVEKASEAPADKAPLQEFTQRVVDEMRARIAPSLPDKPESERVEPTAGDLIREAVENREKYADVFTTVRAKFVEEFGEGSPAVEMIDAELGAIDVRPYSKRLLDRSVKEAHAAMKTSVAELARQHFTKTDAKAADLADALVKVAGLRDADAKQVAADIEARAKELVSEGRRKALANLRKQATATPKTRAVLDAIGRAVELNNLGAMQESDLREIIAKKLGLPAVSSEQMTQLATLADRVETAGSHAARSRAELDLATAIRDVHGVGKMELATSFYYANLLSGYTTHLANAFGNFTNATLQLATVMAANPRRGADALRGWVHGFAEGWQDGRSIMAKGYGRRDLDAKVGAAGSAIERIDYAKHFPNLTAKVAVGLNKHAAALRYVFRAMKAADAVFYYAAREAYMRVAVAKLLEGEFSGRELTDKIRETLKISPHHFIHAAHQADSEGYTGIEKALRVSEVLDGQRRETEVGATAADASERFALEATFNNEPVGWAGVLYHHVAGLTEHVRPGGVPVFKAFLPFLRVPTNVFNSSLNFTPVGAVRAIRGMPEMKTKGGRVEISRREFTDDERTRLFVQSFGSSLAMAGIYALAMGGADDDKEPWFTITATGPSDFRKQEQLRATGWRPHSLKFGDAWVSFKDSPLLVPLAIVGNMVDAHRYQKTRDDLTFGSRAIDATMRGTRALFDTSMLSGLGTLMDFVQDRASAQRAGSFLARIPTDLVVPFSNLLRQIDRTFNPETHTANGPLGDAGAAIPFARNSGSVRTDVLGDPIKSGPLDRFVSTEANDPLREFLRTKNVFVPTAGRDTKIGNRVMTPEEFVKFTQIRGMRLKRELEIRVPMMRPMSREKVEKIVERLAREASEDAKSKIHRAARAPAGR